MLLSVPLKEVAMFNQYHWENHLRSGGRKIVQRFEKELSN